MSLLFCFTKFCQFSFCKAKRVEKYKMRIKEVVNKSWKKYVKSGQARNIIEIINSKLRKLHDRKTSSENDVFLNHVKF